MTIIVSVLTNVKRKIRKGWQPDPSPQLGSEAGGSQAANPSQADSVTAHTSQHVRAGEPRYHWHPALAFCSYPVSLLFSQDKTIWLSDNLGLWTSKEIWNRQNPMKPTQVIPSFRTSSRHVFERWLCLPNAADGTTCSIGGIILCGVQRKSWTGKWDWGCILLTVTTRMPSPVQGMQWSSTWVWWVKGLV